MRATHLTAIDLNLLVALDALLDEASVSRAAARLHRSQPAVSRMLARLRDDLDDPLLVPVGRRMAPTPRAEALREPLKLLLADAARLVAPAAAFDPATASRSFRLMTSDYAQVVLLGRVLQWLVDVAPGVRIEVRAPGAGWEAELASGALELALAPPDRCPPWCDHAFLVADGWACVGRARSALPRTLAEYLARDHVAVDAGQGGDAVDGALASRRRARRVRARLPDFAGALFVAATTDLVATVPRPVAEAAARAMPLAVGAAPFAVGEPRVAMIWPRRLGRDPAHAWLRDAVRRSVAPGGLAVAPRAARAPRGAISAGPRGAGRAAR